MKIGFITAIHSDADLGDLLVPRDFFTSGNLWGWGQNTNGQLGTNDIFDRSSPVQTVAGGANWKSVACGYRHTAAIKTDGTLWMCGYNTYGTLGTNDIINISSPVQTVAGGTDWKSVIGGERHTVAIKTDGTLWTWGRNTYGQLGINTTSDRSSPVQTIAGGTNWKSIACGSWYTAAIKTDGTLWVWGRSTYGTLGTNDQTSKSSPVQTVAGGNNWKFIACGSWHTAAIKTDGTLWTWGRNNYGQLGINDISDRSSPVQTVAGGANWKSVSGGERHTAAIKADGTIWAWGRNSNGQLGINDIFDRSSPVQIVAGGNNWKSVSCGSWHVTAIKTDGTLWNWGWNIGQLGTNDRTDRSSPVQTVAGGNNWKSVACGYNHAIAITDNDL